MQALEVSLGSSVRVTSFPFRQLSRLKHFDMFLSHRLNARTPSTFVMRRAHLDVSKPDLILDSSIWYLL
jgi:hypothetical protein